MYDTKPNIINKPCDRLDKTYNWGIPPTPMPTRNLRSSSQT